MGNDILVVYYSVNILYFIVYMFGQMHIANSWSSIVMNLNIQGRKHPF